MKLSKDTRLAISVALVLTGVMGLSVLIGYIASLRPTLLQACQQACAAYGQTGDLVDQGPASSKPRSPWYMGKIIKPGYPTRLSEWYSSPQYHQFMQKVLHGLDLPPTPPTPLSE